MTHYNDLANCDYFPILEAGPLLAVGWLEPGFEYAQGDPGQEFYKRLKTLLQEPWTPVFFMGPHKCGMCHYDHFYSHLNLFVPGKQVTYAAPQGIVHYVAAHNYCPPAEFCRAVENCPEMGSLEYFEALYANGWPREHEPYDSEASYKAEQLQRWVYKASGDALVARIEAYRAENGEWPATLEETRELAPPEAFWHYEVVDQSFRLELCEGPETTIHLKWEPKFRDWI
jgi:hypothetical protein